MIIFIIVCFSVIMKAVVLVLTVSPLVWGHGGMLWPSTWQDAQHQTLETINSSTMGSDPALRDPITGDKIERNTDFLTDQVFISGYGMEYAGVGEATNPEIKNGYCGRVKTPWAAPGRAPSLGGGCGLFRGPVMSCKEYDCKAKPRPVFHQGASALDIEFPDAATTEWMVGGRHEVAWSTKGRHRGGYTYRLCKIPKEGKKGLTEECFAENVLEFATNYTMVRDVTKPGTWEKVEQKDLTEGTYPAGSAWRHVVKRVPKGSDDAQILRKDMVRVPYNLQEGDYVLSFRWDTQDAQVWSSCSNIKLVLPARK